VTVLGASPAEAISVLSKLLEEAETLSNDFRARIFKEQLQHWTKRGGAKLREWGLNEEASPEQRIEAALPELERMMKREGLIR
jgi:hypothetical protein